MCGCWPVGWSPLAGSENGNPFDPRMEKGGEMEKEEPEKVREKKNVERGLWGAGVTGCMAELRTEPTHRGGAHRQLPAPPHHG